MTQGRPAAWASASVAEEGGVAAATHAVLVMDVEQVDHGAALPPEGVLAQAPMGDYDLIELSVFDAPEARVRWRAEEEPALISEVERTPGARLADADVIPVLVEAALDELWSAGADQAVTVVPVAVAPLYLATGWRELERVSPA